MAYTALLGVIAFVLGVVAAMTANRMVAVRCVNHALRERADVRHLAAFAAKRAFEAALRSALVNAKECGDVG